MPRQKREAAQEGPGMASHVPWFELRKVFNERTERYQTRFGSSVWWTRLGLVVTNAVMTLVGLIILLTIKGALLSLARDLELSLAFFSNYKAAYHCLRLEAAIEDGVEFTVEQNEATAINLTILRSENLMYLGRAAQELTHVIEMVTAGGAGAIAEAFDTPLDDRTLCIEDNRNFSVTMPTSLRRVMSRLVFQTDSGMIEDILAWSEGAGSCEIGLMNINVYDQLWSFTTAVASGWPESAASGRRLVSYLFIVIPFQVALAGVTFLYDWLLMRDARRLLETIGGIPASAANDCAAPLSTGLFDEDHAPSGYPETGDFERWLLRFRIFLGVACVAAVGLSVGSVVNSWAGVTKASQVMVTLRDHQGVLPLVLQMFEIVLRHADGFFLYEDHVPWITGEFVRGQYAVLESELTETWERTSTDGIRDDEDAAHDPLVRAFLAGARDLVDGPPFGLEDDVFIDVFELAYGDLFWWLDPSATGEMAVEVGETFDDAHFVSAMLLLAGGVIAVGSALVLEVAFARERQFIRGLTVIARHIPPPELPQTRVFELFAAAPHAPELSDFGDVIFHNTSDGVLICNPSLVIEDVARQVERRGLVGKPLGSVLPRPRRDVDPLNNVYNFFEAVRLGSEVSSKSVETVASLGSELPVRVDASVIRAPRGVAGYLLKLDSKAELEKARQASEQNALQLAATLGREEFTGEGPARVVALRSWAHTAAETRKFAESVVSAAAGDPWFSVVGLQHRTLYLVARCDPRHALAFARAATGSLSASKEVWSAVVASDGAARWRTRHGRWEVLSSAFQVADEMLDLAGPCEALMSKQQVDETGTWPAGAVAGPSLNGEELVVVFGAGAAAPRVDKWATTFDLASFQ
jgi:hypothetical protein